jgi:hypothetical protein
MEHEVVDGLDHRVAERLLDNATRSVGSIPPSCRWTTPLGSDAHSKPTGDTHAPDRLRSRTLLPGRLRRRCAPLLSPSGI